MNGYFQVMISENETGLRIIKEKDGGVPVGIQEITFYLNRAKIPFQIKDLNNALHSGQEETYFKLSDEPRLPIAESAQVIISQDRMNAVIRFYPPSSNGNGYRLEDIYSELRVGKVAYGYDDAMIESLFQKREYCTDYLVASGKPVVEGKDAEIIYHFETDNRIRPTLLEDGTVDFFHLNVVNHCKKGELLAELIPESRGEDGMDVCGGVIKPKDVKKLALSFGLNIDLSEDKRSIYSQVNGHVSLVSGKVFVADVLEVANVDNSTGNIEYEGNVVVQGNVCTNFKVVAHGDVEIRGVVEGAEIEADGNIVLARGMNGMSKGSLKAGGNVIAKYLENCNVSAGGYVETESILHSVVEAGTEVNVVSKKGFISGGMVSANKVVRVKTLGTTMGATSSIVVGVDPSVPNRLNELVLSITQSKQQLKKMLPIIESTKAKLAGGAKMLPEQLKTLQQLAGSAKTLQEKIAAEVEEIEGLKQILAAAADARVEITGIIYPGTKITVSGLTLMIKEQAQYCMFKKKDGIVQALPLKG